MCALQVIPPKTNRICFVIAPIGDAESKPRLRSDQVLNHIIAPAATACGYETLRADQIAEPGMITSQVIQHLIDDPLVIADLTDHNANVFYELAIRHAVRKHVVLIIDAAQSIPFDVAPNRTIYFDYHDLDSAKRAREEIEQQIKAIEKNPKEVYTPVTSAIDIQNLQRSDKPFEKSVGDIMAILQGLQTGLNEIQQKMRKGEVRFLPPQFAAEDFSGWRVGPYGPPTSTIHSDLQLSPEILEAIKKSLETKKEKDAK